MSLLIGIGIILVAIEIIQRIVNRISYWICMPFGLNYESSISALENSYTLDTLLKDLNYKLEDYIPGSDCEILVNAEARKRYEVLCKEHERNAIKGRILTGFIFAVSICSVFFHYYKIVIN
jgi:hypothetical protein